MTASAIGPIGLSLLCFALVASATTDSRACSVCEPGDPLFSQEGSSAQRVGSFSLYLETRQSSKKSGALAHHDPTGHHEEEAEHHELEPRHAGEDHDEDPSEDPGEDSQHDAPAEFAGRDREENYTSESVLYASWTPLDRLTLTTALPLRFIRIEEQPHDAPSHSGENLGLGDVSLFATALLWRDRPVLPATRIEGRGMLKLPTGKRRERENGELDPHLQLGTGSLDWGLGLAAEHRFIDGAVYTSVFYRFNSEGALDYEYGDVFLANVAFTSDTRYLGESRLLSALRAGAELNFRHAERDTFRGQDYAHSGGSIFYGTPFLELRMGPAAQEKSPWLRLALRLPLGNGGLHGDQSEGIVYSVGLRFSS